MIEALANAEHFRARREEAWSRATPYWLSQPLRHVVDTGQHIVSLAVALVKGIPSTPLIVDIGCGSCWLLEEMLTVLVRFNYIGVDNNPRFVEAARNRFKDLKGAKFSLCDIAGGTGITADADLVVNAFNFFEVEDLGAAMGASASIMKPGAHLLMSTIDKTYLILALSSSWEEFHHNLARYQEIKGVRYGFQKIDLGDGLSEILEYPSVLYSTQDYLEAAAGAGLQLVSYEEQPYTGRAIPKIYCHLIFRKPT